MMTAVSIDTVYSYLYKTPILGGVYLAYDYQAVSILHHVSLSGGAGRLYSLYISDLDYPSLDDLVFQFSLDYFTTFSIWSYDNHRLMSYNRYLNLWLYRPVTDKELMNGWIIRITSSRTLHRTI